MKYCDNTDCPWLDEQEFIDSHHVTEVDCPGALCTYCYEAWQQVENERRKRTN